MRSGLITGWAASAASAAPPRAGDCRGTHQALQIGPEKRSLRTLRSGRPTFLLCRFPMPPLMSFGQNIFCSKPCLALTELKRIIKPGGQVVSCDFVGCAIEQFPISSEFKRQVSEIMPGFVDPEIGRKVAPFMLSLGFRDVTVDIEADKIFTVIGRIDAERRWNWEKQWEAARPQLVRIVGSDEEAGDFINSFPAYQDDAATCSFTALYFTTDSLFMSPKILKDLHNRFDRLSVGLPRTESPGVKCLAGLCR